MTRGYPRKTTAQRGLGNDHQKARRRALATLVDGTPCPRCGHPMYATTDAAARAQLHPRLWHLDLDHTVPRMFGGTVSTGVQLAHRYCNRRHGQRMQATLRKGRRAAMAQYTRW